MIRRERFVSGLAFVSLSLALAVTAMPNEGEDEDGDEGGRVRTVSVDCLDGDSINNALMRHQGRDLVVEIRGICEEDVVVDRDNVTLRGGDPNADGIAAETSDPAVDGFGIALHIRGARRIAIENLKLTSASLAGFMATNANHRPQVEVSNCRMEGNGVLGAFLINSRVRFSDSVFTGNGGAAGGVGVVASEASFLVCLGCLVKDNPAGTEDVAVQLQLHSSANFAESELEGAFAVFASNSSVVSLNDTSVAGAVLSIIIDRSTQFRMVGGALEGPFRASNKSNIEFFGVKQSALPSDDFNLAQHDSYVRLRGLAPEDPADPVILSEMGHIFFFGFSNGHFRSSTIKQLTCVDESEASCGGGSVTVTGPSTCAACPPPP